MKTKLRELVNKAFPERLKLEFGCLIFIEEPKLALIKLPIYAGNYKIVQKEYHDRAKRFELFLIKDSIQLNHDKMYRLKSERIEELQNLSLIKILGKPTSWCEILRMLNKPDEIIQSPYHSFEPCKENYTLLNVMFGVNKQTTFDLTRSPEEQEPEVLEKLVELLNN